MILGRCQNCNLMNPRCAQQSLYNAEEDEADKDKLKILIFHQELLFPLNPPITLDR